MIEKPTVLVLGAGASVDYGFPSGRKLLGDIVRDLSSSTTALWMFLADLGFPPQALSAFAKALDLSAKPSVDAFLERRPGFQQLGKRAIAGALIPHEDPTVLYRRTEERWYEYLFSKLDSQQEDFAENRLSIVTFNYDRSLEQFLLTSVRNTYEDLDVDEAANLVTSIPIVHVHGDLGSLFLEDGEISYREYSPDLDHRSLTVAADRIRIISDGKAVEPAFEEAHRLLSEAEIVAFIGFGYHADNVRRLAVNDHYKAKTKDRRLYGSALGLGRNEVRGTVRLFDHKIELGDTGDDALKFLKNMPVFD